MGYFCYFLSPRDLREIKGIDISSNDRLEICCGAGDLLLLNTKVRRSPYGSRAASA